MNEFNSERETSENVSRDPEREGQKRCRRYKVFIVRHGGQVPAGGEEVSVIKRRINNERRRDVHEGIEVKRLNEIKMKQFVRAAKPPAARAVKTRDSVKQALRIIPVSGRIPDVQNGCKKNCG